MTQAFIVCKFHNRTPLEMMTNKLGFIEVTSCKICIQKAYERGFKEGQEYSKTLYKEAMETINFLKTKIDEANKNLKNEITKLRKEVTL